MVYIELLISQEYKSDSNGAERGRMATEGRTKSMYLFVGLLANKSAIKDSGHGGGQGLKFI